MTTGATSGTSDNEQKGEDGGSARGDEVPPRKSSRSAGAYRIYSKRGEEKAYLRVEGDGFTWVRSWRDATAWHSPIDCDKVMAAARAREPERPMCRVMWGTRLANLETR